MHDLKQGAKGRKEDHRSPATLRSRAITALKGVAMGIADSVPGVSGGTIAVMAGIYEELIESLRHLNPVTLWSWRRLGLAGFWRAVNGGFLFSLALGILSALYVSAGAVLYLLEHEYPLIMAFFCGLVFASTCYLRREVERWDLRELGWLALGVFVTLLISFANPLQGNTSLPSLFVCGAVAICAMILPGISGAYVLLLLGVYDHVLQALRALQFDVIVVFASGCAIGLLSFSHLLSWTFFHFRQQTYAFLTGMLAASVLVLWPWKLTPEGAAAQYLSPSGYAAATSESVSVLLVMLMLVLGFAVVAGFARIAGRNK
jgi:putative membrane protein